MISVCPPRLTSGPQPAHDARPHPHRVFMQQRRVSPLRRQRLHRGRGGAASNRRIVHAVRVHGSALRDRTGGPELHLHRVSLQCALGQRGLSLDDCRGPGAATGAPRPDSPLVFHRDGIPVRRWRTAWRTACQAAFARPVVPASTPDCYVRRGLASWYGDAFDGKPTASGEPFDSNGGLTRLNRLIYQNL